jgi:hypothetical protein
MSAAYDTHRHRCDALLQEHCILTARDFPDDFLLHVHNSFFMGVHEAYQSSILEALTRELGTQQNIAEALGLKDRSSISQMLRSGTMDGIRVTAALYQCPTIQLPTRELAALFGFARATSFIKSVAYRDRSIEGSMKPQDFSYLVGVLANDQWDRAIRDTDPTRARRLAEEIVNERTIARFGPVRKDGGRPEQLVLMLQGLWFAWADFAILSLWAIPECFPEVIEA